MKSKNNSKANIETINSLSQSMLDVVTEKYPDCDLEEFISAQLYTILKVASISSKNKDKKDVELAYHMTNNTAQELMNYMFSK